jgi:protein SCO1/2
MPRRSSGAGLLACRPASARRCSGEVGTFHARRKPDTRRKARPHWPLAAILLFAGCSKQPSLPTYGTVPPFQLTDQTGAAFDSAKTLEGRVWVADFFFTNCPGPCPRMSSQMHQVQTALEGTDARLVSITVDPARDTPEVLVAYSRRFKAEPGVWYFLTGARERLQHLSKNVFKLGDVDGTLEHSTRFALVDRQSRIRGYYVTSEPDAIPRLIAGARALLKESP